MIMIDAMLNWRDNVNIIKKQLVIIKDVLKQLLINYQRNGKVI